MRSLRPGSALSFDGIASFAREPHMSRPPGSSITAILPGRSRIAGAALPTAGGHATVPGRRGRLRLSVRHKLTLFSTLVILAVSSGFTWVSLGLARRAIEEDLQNRAIVYAREVAAAIGRGRELESAPEIHQLIVRLL